ncbi:MAG: diguanylate cyclase [Gammaproteobacteria bacterium]|nr:diguanylate cyclase [Gammaproteobacteria bacterium]MCP5136653.1 diguanylate cyclase [Gammaproteobacteria bacterium]
MQAKNKTIEHAANQAISGAPGTGFLFAGLSAIVLFMLAVASLGLYHSARIGEDLGAVVDVDISRMELVRKMRDAARERVTVLHTIADTADPFEREALIGKFYGLGTVFLRNRELLIEQALDATESGLLERHRQMAIEFAPQQREVLRLIEEDQIDSARELLVQDAVPNQLGALVLLESFIEYERDRSQRVLAHAQEMAAQTRTHIALVTALGVLVSLGIAIVLHRHLRKLLETLVLARDGLELRVEERTRELTEAKDELRRLAHFDSLTGLPNRALFSEMLEKSLPRARRNNASVALLFIDLDGFKAVNDNYGHDVGDALLREAAARMQALLRGEDMVARLGGDEFTVVLADMENAHNGAATVAQKIIDSISQPFMINEIECGVNASIGVALFPADAEDADALIRAADQAMYRVKQHGKNHYLFHAPEHSDDA